MTIDETCSRCKQREVEYDIEDGLCEACWIDWWVSEFEPEDRDEERRSIEAMLADKKSWSESAREAYHDAVMDWAKLEILSKRLREERDDARFVVQVLYDLRGQELGDKLIEQVEKRIRSWEKRPETDIVEP